MQVGVNSITMPSTDSPPSNNEGQSQPENEQPNGPKRQKSRHRASVACATCRERRIRCVVPQGDSECVQCRRAGTECIIKNDDERRRPISRAYMSTLTDRVALLEGMLKDHGSEPPPVVYPPKTTRGTLTGDGESSPSRQSYHPRQSSTNREPAIPENTSPSSLHVMEDAGEGSHGGSNASVDGQRDRGEQDATQGTPIDDKKVGILSRLLSTRGHLSFDQISGRLRYYGPTVNSHIYSELEVDDTKSNRDNLEQARRAEKVIRTLPMETHEYLMSLFWQHYNGVLHVVHEEAFNEDREAGRTGYYSGFLHICILAMGYRFADKSRADMQRIALPDRESTLHREAKYMLDLELERPGGMPSVAALLILGDSEVGVGRDNVGWMYAGMAMRLCYDIGLHLDSRQSGMTQREIDIRKMTMWACVIYDRYWSLFLGRPTTMKSADLEIYSLSDHFERLGTCMPATSERSLNTRIYEALIDLMEIAGKIVENTEHRKMYNEQTPDQSAYFRMAALDREIHNWAARLPADLRYTEENRATAPFSFYLLHQQYHAVLILLHRPFARYDDPNNQESEEVSALDSHFSRASRGICTKSAVAIARIFWHHRQRFDGKQIFCIGMQHAGAAATALIAALAYIPDATDRTNNMSYLEVLHHALQDMAHAYQPAERMAQVLNAVMIELRGGPISPGKHISSTSSTIPARRGSTVMDFAERPTMKRRQTDTTRKSKPMPPPTSSRNHRTSDASAASQPLQHGNDFVMVTPRTEGSGSGWPDVHTMDTFQDQALLPTPDTTNMISPGRRTDWLNGGLAPGDFPTMPSMGMMPGLDTDTFPEFLTLPNDDDWSRWHNGPDVTPHDLDGMQFGKFT
ncbi:uncharacterized protein LTR77_005750 [Saxophila tyrrhenica]|uniref:Zn(2)-C6 fungal-type domain-containing protein n=1 Tax=Saxophila tyrrhenica TaxID=1690608 RepID=A0AAV9PDF4_9PEZI|nr:hypothetical protein LTR77_005750 [Saxophila tyrrhenica]